ncbi:hypothetical protein D3C81_2037600 [compost metagenome]
MVVIIVIVIIVIIIVVIVIAVPLAIDIHIASLVDVAFTVVDPHPVTDVVAGIHTVA